ncbi:MAG: beta-ketoacyl-[acyl-carrier-protein] synthase family protein [Opitutales bacterium]|jgi:3-oxoacyl-[acyl-carrier-protein] synthase-1
MSHQVVVTGVGFISPIGNSQASVVESLRQLRHGFSFYPRFEQDNVPVRLAGLIKDFNTESVDAEDWTYPGEYKIKRETVRGFAPHVLFAYCALTQALADARLAPQEISSEDTGLFTASSGSASMLHYNVARMLSLGVSRCPPLGVVSSVVGTLSYNLVAAFKILGSSCGFASACASSGHALGFAWEEVAAGRQKRMLVVGGEDGNFECLLPFAGMRALSPSRDPETASRPFDRDRNGFVGAGGACALVLETGEEAARRGATVYCEMSGWGQASDGYNVAISHPDGVGLAQAMRVALRRTGLQPGDVDYINAHATSTPIGDISEIRAIKTVFGAKGENGRPAISSTKALTGHPLSLASILEAGICALAIKHGFTPGSAHIKNLEPEALGLNILRANLDQGPRVVLSNSSGFGGANVVLVFRKA